MQMTNSGFITMVPVGDEDWFRRHQSDYFIYHVGIGHRPQPAHYAEMIGRLQRRRLPNYFIERPLDFIPFVWEQAKHRTEIHAGSPKQYPAIFLGARKRFLVGINSTVAERFQPHAR